MSDWYFFFPKQVNDKSNYLPKFVASDVQLNLQRLFALEDRNKKSSQGIPSYFVDTFNRENYKLMDHIPPR